MKSMQLNLLKSFKTIGHCKQERVIRLKASDGYIPASPPPPPPEPPSLPQTTPIHRLQEEEEEGPQSILGSPLQEPEIIEVSELMKDLEDEEIEFLDEIDDKENIRPAPRAKHSEDFNPLKPKIESLIGKESKIGNSRFSHLSEIDVSWFEQAVIEPRLQEAEIMTVNLDDFSPSKPKIESLLEKELKTRDSRSSLSEIDVSKFQEAERMAVNSDQIEHQEPPTKERKIEGINVNPLLDFEEKCPPGGYDSVILYTTGLRGVRKTFEDCQNTRFLLQNFRVSFFDRDISMHSEFKEEMWGILGQKMLPPRLFIKGRYIGGAEKVFALHEQGKLKPLLEGIPLVDYVKEHCGGCGGMRFILCFKCNGSRKLHVHGLTEKSAAATFLGAVWVEPASKPYLINGGGDHGEWKKCQECNENGLIVCPLCC